MIAPLDATLGRIAAPPSAAPFDDIRLSMLSVLLTARPQAATGHGPWQLAWEGAADQLRDRVLDQARRQLAHAAAHSRYPRRRLTALVPDAETAVMLRNRILAAGMPLEEFELAPEGPEMDRRRAAALEHSWEAATRVALSDTGRWSAIAAQVQAWRPPMRAFWVVAAVIVVTAVIAGAWLGGQVTAPQWFRPVHDWWWSLPWP